MIRVFIMGLCTHQMVIPSPMQNLKYRMLPHMFQLSLDEIISWLVIVLLLYSISVSLMPDLSPKEQFSLRQFMDCLEIAALYLVFCAFLDSCGLTPNCLFERALLFVLDLT